MRFAVLGYPAKHSLSPKIFNFLKGYFGAKGTHLDFSYEILEIAPENFLKYSDLLENYDGLNITSPYKEKILEFAQKKSPEVEMLKAANVLKKNGNKFEAFNTDVFGFKESLSTFDLSNLSALVIGSSGAARAAILGLYNLGVQEIFVKARDFSNLKNFDVAFSPYTNQSPGLVIQATTIGMHNNTKDLDFFNIDYSKTQIAYDLIYYPKVTPFMEQAQKKNVPHVINGEAMLAHQALKTFEHWFGHLGEKNSNVLEKLKEIL